MKAMKVLIVGLGRIAYRGFGDNRVETHLKAINDHENLTCVGGVDNDKEARDRWERETGLKAYDAVWWACTQTKPDIVVIASPPDTHEWVIEALGNQSYIKGILCEKPLADTVEGAKAVIRHAGSRTLVVGHQRRYESRHRAIRDFAHNAVLGVVRQISIFFSGDALSNGSHAADTARWMVPNGIHHLYHVLDNCFRIRIDCARGSVMLDSRGDLAAGYMKAMYDDLIHCMQKGRTPQCSGSDGLEAVKMALEAIKRSERAA
jgi:predicted dehydrogenase